MKRVFRSLILGSIFLLPTGVFADASFDLVCPTSVKKGDTITCTIKSTVSDPNETLNVVTGTYEGDSLISQTGNIDKNNLNITSTGEVDKISLIAGNTAGNGEVTVKIKKASGLESQEEGDPIDKEFITTEVIKKATVKILDDSTNISGIKIDGTTSSICKVGDTSCTIQNIKKATVAIDVTATSPAQVTKGNGKVNLKCGSNKHVVTITAEDKTTKDYTFNLNRTCDDTVTLKGITLSKGELSPAFSSTTKSYKVEVESDVDKITISGTKAVENQTITGEVKDRALQYGDNKFSLVVKSESGKTSTYLIVVTRKDDRSENNYLKDITLSEGKLSPSFDKEVTEYRTKVLYETEEIDVVGEKDHEKAVVTYEGKNKKLVVGENTILIKVKSEKQQEKVYKIIVERLEEGETLGDNPNLTNIKVNGYDLGFTYNKSYYTLEIESKDKTLDIEAIPEETTSTYEIKGNENLKNGSTITITVTSLDGTTKDYEILIEKSNTMLILIIAGCISLVAVVAIIILLIKNKKGKDSATTTKVKKQLKHDDEILKKVQNQLNEIEKTAPRPVVTPTTPLSIAQDAPRPRANVEQPTYRQEVRQEQERPVTRQSYMESLRSEEPKREIAQEQVVRRPVVKEEVKEDIPPANATRVCSICGHRVSVTLKTCPYCKRSF